MGFSIIGILYFDPFHKPVETIDILIGKNLDFANKTYFKTEADESVSFNINSELNEFRGGVLSKKSLIKDSIIHQYTWNYLNYKKTIWVAETQTQKFQIIDAIRYKSNVNF
jgi:hypothetical protein